MIFNILLSERNVTRKVSVVNIYMDSGKCWNKKEKKCTKLTRYVVFYTVKQFWSGLWYYCSGEWCGT